MEKNDKKHLFSTLFSSNYYLKRYKYFNFPLEKILLKKNYNTQQ